MLTIESFKLLLSFFFNQTFRPPLKRFFVYSCFLAFLALTTLFFQYIDLYQQAYIEQLKRVYPATFMETRGKHVEPLPGFRHSDEVFEFSKTLRFRFAAGQNTKALLDVGIRGVETLPGGETKPEVDTVYLTPRVYDRVCSSTAFDGRGVYLVDAEGSEHYCLVRPFQLVGEKNWVVLSVPLAWELGYSPNIATVYPAQSMTDGEVRTAYAASKLPVTLWSERLPFFSAVFHSLLGSFFNWLMAGTLILIFILNLGYIKDTLREFKNIIIFSSLYGISWGFVQLAFCIYLTSWFVLLYGSAFLLKVMLNSQIFHLVPIIGEMLEPAFYPGLLTILLVVLNLLIVGYIKFNYARRTAIFGT